MFTPEDEIDELDVELGRLRRRLEACQRSLFDGRMTDPYERAESERLIRERIAELREARNAAIAMLIADAEGFQATEGERGA